MLLLKCIILSLLMPIRVLTSLWKPRCVCVFACDPPPPSGPSWSVTLLTSHLENETEDRSFPRKPLRLRKHHPRYIKQLGAGFQFVQLILLSWFIFLTSEPGKDSTWTQHTADQCNVTLQVGLSLFIPDDWHYVYEHAGHCHIGHGNDLIHYIWTEVDSYY